MCGIVGVIRGDELALWRVVFGQPIPWTRVRGDRPRLLRALRSACELDFLAEELGGWANVLCLGFDAPKPRHPVKVSPRVLLEDDLDRRLG